MVDLRNDPVFSAAVAATRHAIFDLAASGIPDAKKLALREEGWNNLQGHAASIVPLAVWFARRYPDLVRSVREYTDLRGDMSGASAEARDAELWEPIQAAVRTLILKRGKDIIAQELASGRPQTAAQVARTYLSVKFGGSQRGGGAGNSVLKRTIKIMAHIIHQ